jgi:hypothetical protein
MKIIIGTGRLRPEMLETLLEMQTSKLEPGVKEVKSLFNISGGEVILVASGPTIGAEQLTGLFDILGHGKEPFLNAATLARINAVASTIEKATRTRDHKRKKTAKNLSKPITRTTKK